MSDLNSMLFDIWFQSKPVIVVNKASTKTSKKFTMVTEETEM